MQSLIDIGANLTHESFRHDLDDVIARAKNHGITRMIVTGASAQGALDARALAQAHPGTMWATAGVHPHHACDYNDEVEILLRELHQDPLVVAVGETGLDYNRNYSPRDAQLFAFERQLELGASCGKPLFLHQRDAHLDFLAAMKNFSNRLSRVVVHCFTGTREELFDYLDQDWYIGITGWICDERRGAHLRELVQHIPAERLLLETDAPYLLPRTIQPMPKHRRNEPMYLKHIAEEIARDRNQSVSEVASNSSNAAEKFFAI